MTGPPSCLYRTHKHAGEAIDIVADGFMLFHWLAIDGTLKHTKAAEDDR